MASPLDAIVRADADGARITLTGRLDRDGDEALAAAYVAARATGTGPITLDFTAAGYINSTGIALIVTLLAKARKAHIRLLTCGLSEHYIEIFNITRLADFMSVYPDEMSALADKSELSEA